MGGGEGKDGGRWFAARRMGDSRLMRMAEGFAPELLWFGAEPAAVQSFSVFTRLGKFGTSRCRPVRRAGSHLRRIGRGLSFANLSPAESGASAFQWSGEGGEFAFFNDAQV